MFWKKKKKSTDLFLRNRTDTKLNIFFFLTFSWRSSSCPSHQALFPRSQCGLGHMLFAEPLLPPEERWKCPTVPKLSDREENGSHSQCPYTFTASEWQLDLWSPPPVRWHHLCGSYKDLCSCHKDGHGTPVVGLDFDVQLPQIMLNCSLLAAFMNHAYLAFWVECIIWSSGSPVEAAGWALHAAVWIAAYSRQRRSCLAWCPVGYVCMCLCLACSLSASHCRVLKQSLERFPDVRVMRTEACHFIESFLNFAVDHNTKSQHNTNIVV